MIDPLINAVVAVFMSAAIQRGLLAKVNLVEADRTCELLLLFVQFLQSFLVEMCGAAHMSLLNLLFSLFIAVARSASGTSTFVADRGKFW